MELRNGIRTLYAKSRREWRSWLEKNQSLEKAIWLINYHEDVVFLLNLNRIYDA
jgi:hypothetical protein